MRNTQPTEQELKELAKQIDKDQKKASPAEKRLKVKTTFKNAIKKMGRTPPPKKDSK
jgi:hypothetical protein